MRLGSLVLGLIGLLVGAIWILQGVGVLAGSFMTGQRLWLVIGIVVAVIGVALTYRGLRRPARS
jgi:hypothetical protein